VLPGKKKKNLPYTNLLRESSKNNKRGKIKGTSNMLCDVKSEAIQTKNKVTSKDAVRKIVEPQKQ
jgi:hypothetical protein